MPITAQDFRAAMPAFADVTKFPTASVTFWLDLAYKRHNAERWGEMLDAGIQLYVAHELSVDASSALTPGAPGQINGNITSRSVGGMSYSRDVSSATEPDAGYMNLSTYGVRWRQLMKLVGAGPLHVGTPSPNDLGTTRAWPGPGYF